MYLEFLHIEHNTLIYHKFNDGVDDHSRSLTNAHHMDCWIYCSVCAPLYKILARQWVFSKGRRVCVRAYTSYAHVDVYEYEYRLTDRATEKRVSFYKNIYEN